VIGDDNNGLACSPGTAAIDDATIDAGKIQGAVFLLTLMACLWVSEALAIYTTALLPLVLAPMMGIVSASPISFDYMGDLIILLIGAFEPFTSTFVFSVV
jgi:di/tricarboxylate transporter